MNSLQPNHPLDPLTTSEIERAVSVVRGHEVLGERILFEQVRLLEPEKSAVRNFQPDDPVQRRAFASVLDRDSGKVYEAVVSLDDAVMESWVHIPGVQICITTEECDELACLVVGWIPPSLHKV